jgi:hypothetical protein
MEQLLVRQEDVVKILGISLRGVKAMTASGELPVIRLGRAVRYDIRALRRFVDELSAGTIKVTMVGKNAVAAKAAAIAEAVA